MDIQEYIEKFKDKGLDYPQWIVGLVPDSDVGLGISYLWQLSPEHPLHLSSVIHDLEYQIKNENDSRWADYRLLKNFILQSNGSYKLIALSFIFYCLATIWGKISWNKNINSIKKNGEFK